ncbi:hypothetical protein HK103_002887 [Boothiomyces macroporosus]|uniref:Ribosomal protein L44 n=1 Tax=Boothiomyces macroporosus TaxID=261099 RepID=A0AAD5UA09_9FUNG|nr:hypothetical protein HK103_002887 [Boothiomyces macroporosus]
MSMLKFIKSVKLGFSPTAINGKSTRTLLTRLKTDKNVAASKCEFDIKTKDSISEPFVHIEFVDKKEMKFNPANLKVDEMVMDITRYSKRLQLQEEINQQ